MGVAPERDGSVVLLYKSDLIDKTEDKEKSQENRQEYFKEYNYYYS